MATLTVEGLPDALLARLARTAAANGRCLNSELIVLLARTLPAAGEAGPSRPAGARPVCPPLPGRMWRGPAAAGSPARGVGWGGPAG